MNELAIRDELSSEQKALLKRTIAAGTTDDEFALFVYQIERTHLDPFARQIYCFKNRQGRLSINATIDGFRLVAERSGKIDGQLGPFWCGEDGVWKDVWLDKKPPAAAKVGILRKGCREPFWGVALYSGYVQMGQNGPVGRWSNDPAGMLAKCSEALGLRKAFPQELSGIYSSEEMPFEEPIEKDVTPKDIVIKTPEPHGEKITPKEEIIQGEKPTEAEVAIYHIKKYVVGYPEKKAVYFKGNGGEPTEKQLQGMKGLVAGWLESLVMRPQELTPSNRDFAREMRRVFLRAVFGREHLDELTVDEIGGLLDWLGLESRKDGEKKVYVATSQTDEAKKGIDCVLADLSQKMGQTKLPGTP
jgi:phage recombination protein Bet